MPMAWQQLCLGPEGDENCPAQTVSAEGVYHRQEHLSLLVTHWFHWRVIGLSELTELEAGTDRARQTETVNKYCKEEDVLEVSIPDGTYAKLHIYP